MKKVQFSQEEMTELKMTSNGNSVNWDNTKAKDISVEFTEAEKSVILERLKEMDKDDNLGDHEFEIYTLFKV